MLMGPLISEPQRDKVDGYVQAAVADGAKVATGGERPEHLPNGFFYEPTLLVDVDPDAAVAQEEIFGPVLVVLPYRRRRRRRRHRQRLDLRPVRRRATAPTPSGPRAVARRLRIGTVSVNGGMYYGARRPLRRLQAVGHRPGDGRRRPRGVPRAQDARPPRDLTGHLMAEPLAGVRVLEVAMYGFVTSAGAVLSDWGAEVLKVEHAVTGDPQRGLRRTGSFVVEGDLNPNVEHPNRGKRSIGLDISVAVGPGRARRPGHAGRRVPHQPAARQPAAASASTSTTSGP